MAAAVLPYGKLALTRHVRVDPFARNGNSLSAIPSQILRNLPLRIAITGTPALKGQPNVTAGQGICKSNTTYGHLCVVLSQV